MSNKPQNPIQPSQKAQYSSQGTSDQNKKDPTSKVGSNIRKDEPTAEKRTDSMKGESSYKSGEQPSQSGVKPSNT